MLYHVLLRRLATSCTESWTESALESTGYLGNARHGKAFEGFSMTQRNNFKYFISSKELSCDTILTQGEKRKCLK